MSVPVKKGTGAEGRIYNTQYLDNILYIVYVYTSIHTFQFVYAYTYIYIFIFCVYMYMYTESVALPEKSK